MKIERITDLFDGESLNAVVLNENKERVLDLQRSELSETDQKLEC